MDQDKVFLIKKKKRRTNKLYRSIASQILFQIDLYTQPSPKSLNQFKPQSLKFRSSSTSQHSAEHHHHFSLTKQKPIENFLGVQIGSNLANNLKHMSINDNSLIVLVSYATGHIVYVFLLVSSYSVCHVVIGYIV